jgi:hypothetical protein
MPVTKAQLVSSIKKYIYKRNKKVKYINKIKYFLISFILPPKFYEKLRVNFGEKMSEILNCANFYLSKNISVDINALKEIKSHIEAFHSAKIRRYGK